ncbi:uncharacterized protein LOC119113050 [Pollicipes pollicipes]|uniref:uncharacterized protein LOC119113050 n=1 Tax=Pollicipes pollicipes TaxID=41117 RepID=UPI001884D621|nr:uncharacterized protein LOC119113050 [Pollicipes pollicipes]
MTSTKRDKPLRELVEDLRRSLAVSDARNIGLELRAQQQLEEPTMGRSAESDAPAVRAIEAETNRSLSEAQRNFDALIRELRAISEPRAPYHPELSLEDELERTHEALRLTQSDLERSRAAVCGARGTLRGKDRQVLLARQDLMAAEAAAARTRDEVKLLQSELQASQHQLEMERLAHGRADHQLDWTRAQLAERQTALEEGRTALRNLHQSSG